MSLPQMATPLRLPGRQHWAWGSCLRPCIPMDCFCGARSQPQIRTSAVRGQAAGTKGGSVARRITAALSSGLLTFWRPPAGCILLSHREDNAALAL